MIQIVGVAGHFIEVGQGAKNDALIVSPRRLPIVVAGTVQSVIDQVLRIDHSTGLEPGPFVGRPIEKTARAAVARSALVQSNGGEKKQFVGNRILISAILAPPHPAAASRSVPTGEQIGENRFGHVQKVCIAGEIVSANPGVGPPGLVVIVVVDEVTAGVQSEGIGQDGQVLPIVIRHNHILQRLETIGSIPPAGGVIQSAGIVPLLENEGRSFAVGIEIIARGGTGRTAANGEDDGVGAAGAGLPGKHDVRDRTGGIGEENIRRVESRVVAVERIDCFGCDADTSIGKKRGAIKAKHIANQLLGCLCDCQMCL